MKKNVLVLILLLIVLAGNILTFALNTTNPEISINFNRTENQYNFQAMNNSTIIYIDETCLNKKCNNRFLTYNLINSNNQTLVVKFRNFYTNMQNNLEILELRYPNQTIKPKSKIMVKNPVINREFNQNLKTNDESVNINFNHFKNYTRIFIKEQSARPINKINESLLILNIYSENGEIKYYYTKENAIIDDYCIRNGCIYKIYLIKNLN